MKTGLFFGHNNEYEDHMRPLSSHFREKVEVELIPGCICDYKDFSRLTVAVCHPYSHTFPNNDDELECLKLSKERIIQNPRTSFVIYCFPGCNIRVNKLGRRSNIVYLDSKTLKTFNQDPTAFVMGITTPKEKQ